MLRLASFGRRECGTITIPTRLGLTVMPGVERALVSPATAERAPHAE